MENIIKNITNGPGFYLYDGLGKDDLKKIYKYVENKFLNHLKKLCPQNVDTFKKYGMNKYHLNSHLIDHKSSWPRKIRLFDDNGINLIKETNLFLNLKKIFKDIIITNEIENEKSEIVWRIVRPNMDNDVGPIHTDGWFWEANKWHIPKDKTCIKVWVMLDGETDNSGLSVIPDTHKKLDWDYTFEKRDGIQKPNFDFKKYDLKPKILKTRPGSAVIFSYNLLHGGAVTRGNLCRISLEFTLFTPKKNLV